MKTFCLVMLFLSTLVGCASKRADLYRGQILGKSTMELLQCAGAPAGKFKHGALKVLTYSFTTPHFVGTPAMSQRLCDASVFIEHDVITSVTYRTVYGSDACEPIFRSCIVGT
jgi:hypothetical protein